MQTNMLKRKLGIIYAEKAINSGFKDAAKAKNIKAQAEYESYLEITQKYVQNEDWNNAKDFAEKAINCGYKDATKAENIKTQAEYESYLEIAQEYVDEKDWNNEKAINSGYNDITKAQSLKFKYKNEIDKAEIERRKEIFKELGIEKGENITFDLGNGVDLELVWIPPGTFSMGNLRSASYKPIKAKIKRAIWMGKYEVTQAQWEQIMHEHPSYFNNVTINAPVESITPNECLKFCNKLSNIGFVKNVFRLPADAEWEYACRAGTKSACYLGNYVSNLKRAGWFVRNSSGRVHSVGHKVPNSFGLYDMLGNVAELTLEKNARGGSFCSSPSRCTSYSYEHFIQSSRMGFRVVFDPVGFL